MQVHLLVEHGTVKADGVSIVRGRPTPLRDGAMLRLRSGAQCSLLLGAEAKLPRDLVVAAECPPAREFALPGCVFVGEVVARARTGRLRPRRGEVAILETYLPRNPFVSRDWLAREQRYRLQTEAGSVFVATSLKAGRKR